MAQHPPERVILVCEECGERLVLADPLSVRLSEGSTIFECECGNKGVTLASRLPDEEGAPLPRGRRRSLAGAEEGGPRCPSDDPRGHGVVAVARGRHLLRRNSAGPIRVNRSGMYDRIPGRALTRASASCSARVKGILRLRTGCRGEQDVDMGVGRTTGGDYDLSDPVGSFADVVRRVLLQPAAFFAGLPRQGSLLNPLSFALICTAIYVILVGRV